MSQVVCNSFKVELFKAIHDFTASTGDTFKIALYTAASSIGAATTVYTATNEASGTGYTPGGATLTSVTPSLDGNTVVMDFADVTISTVTLTYRKALIYNSTKANRAVAVFDFGSDRVISGGNLIIQMPVPDASSAILRAN
jgi:flagellar basal body rod protein FlgB